MISIETLGSDTDELIPAEIVPFPLRSRLVGEALVDPDFNDGRFDGMLGFDMRRRDAEPDGFNPLVSGYLSTDRRDVVAYLDVTAIPLLLAIKGDNENPNWVAHFR